MASHKPRHSKKRRISAHALKLLATAGIATMLIVSIGVNAQITTNPSEKVPTKIGLVTLHSLTSTPRVESLKPVTSVPAQTTSTPVITPTAVSSETTNPVTAHKTVPTVTPSPSSNVSSLTPSSTSTSSSSPSSSQTPTTPPTTTGYTSTNWSGYMASDGSFTDISGSWHVPQAANSNGVTSADATWVGIGGVSTSDLIQVGTNNTVSPSGQDSAAGFYELLPGDSQPTPGLSISPGDAVNASLTETSTNQWAINLVDTSNNESFTASVSYDSSLSSAEWIEEDPSYSNHQLVPFDEFGSVAMTGASTTENGAVLNLNGSLAQEITMVNEYGQAIATPSAIGSDGASFSVERNNPT